MPWSVYVLKCRDGTYYTGSTAYEVEDRVKVHNAGKGSKYVRSRLPATLVYRELNYTRSEALKRECQIKRLSRQGKQALWYDV
jgi:putative endonuclease